MRTVFKPNCNVSLTTVPISSGSGVTDVRASRRSQRMALRRCIPDHPSAVLFVEGALGAIGPRKHGAKSQRDGERDEDAEPWVAFGLEYPHPGCVRC